MNLRRPIPIRGENHQKFGVINGFLHSHAGDFVSAVQRASILSIMSETEYALIAVNIGNTRTGVALFFGKELQRSSRVSNAEIDSIADLISSLADEISEHHLSTVRIVLASVNDSVVAAITKVVRKRMPDAEIHQLGVDFEAPIGRQLEVEAMVGQDRLLNAAAAYDALKQACIIVDAGTAVTVDFVDGEGTFHGGAIAPGARMQVEGLHEHTALLPDVEFAAPEEGAFGVNTAQAMLHGVFYGIRGMVRYLAERYAEAYRAYPTVIATGGDAHLIFDDDALIEHIDDDLALRGIEAACRLAMEHAEKSETKR